MPTLLDRSLQVTLFEAVCLMMGGLAAVEMARGLWAVHRWTRGQLDAMSFRRRVWVQPLKIALGASALVLAWFAPARLGLFGAAAGFVLIMSVVIPRCAPLRRYKPIRMLQGMRLVASLAAAWVCGLDLLR